MSESESGERSTSIAVTNAYEAEDKKRSKAWQYFTVVDATQSKAKCNTCGKILSYKGGGPFNLIRHTKSVHTLIYSAICENGEASTSAAASSIPSMASTSALPQPVALPVSSARSTKISQYFTKPVSAKKTANLNDMVIKLFAKNYLSFHLVESPEFKNLIAELNPNYQLPSRKTLSNALLTNAYNVIKMSVKADLEKAAYVSLTTDGWTSKPNDNYLSVTVHFIDEHAELKTYLLACVQYSDRHTADNLATELKKVTDDWDLTKKVVAATCDNAPNIKSAVRKNHWQVIPCFAHTINLVVQAALKEIRITTNKVKSIVEVFRRSPLATEKLRNMQKKLGEPNLKVKQDVVTRWNSTFDMFERIIMIKNSVMSTIAIEYPETENITSEDIEIISAASEVLQVFKDVTEEMSSERKVTVSEIILISNALKKKCSAFESRTEGMPESVHKMCVSLLHELSVRFDGIEENNFLAETTLLDPRFKKYGFQNEFSLNRAIMNIKTMAARSSPSVIESTTTTAQVTSSPPQKRKRSIWDDFDREVNHITRPTNPTAAGIIEVDKYLDEPLLQRSSDPNKWWLSKKECYPRLYDLSKKRLGTVATSVPSERIFSKAGQILVERRNRLSGAKLSKLLFLSVNMK